MKLITYCTPSHEPLLRLLLASEVSEYDVCVLRGPQVSEEDYHGAGWNLMADGKMQGILAEATEDFLFCDADVMLLQPSLAALREEMNGRDCLFQDDGWLCSGLFAMRGNEACRQLLRDTLTELRHGGPNGAGCEDEQIALNRVIGRSGVRYGKLSTLWANPYTITGGHWNGGPLPLPPGAVAFHANWTVGVARKLELLGLVAGASA